MENKHIVTTLSITLLCIVLALQSVSALNWGTAIDYDSDSQTASLSNGVLGLSLPDFLGGGEIGTATLITPTYFEVPAGNDVLIAEINVKGVESFSDVLDKVESYNLKNNGRKEDRQFTYKIKSYVQELGICEDKSLPSCQDYNRTVWTPVNSVDLLNGEVTVGIFTDTQYGQIFDYVPTILGATIDEWAVIQVVEATGFGYGGGTDGNQARASGLQFFSGGPAFPGGPSFIINNMTVTGVNNCADAYILNASRAILDKSISRVGNTFYFTNQTATSFKFYYGITNQSGGCSYNWLNGVSYNVSGTYLNWTAAWNSVDNQNTTNNAFSIVSLGITIPEQVIPKGYVITLNTPANNTNYSSSTLIFNATLAPTSLNNTNATLSIWYSNSTLFQEIYNSTVGTNTTIVWNWTVLNLPDGDNFKWNVFGCGSNGTFVNCTRATNGNFTFSIDTTSPTIVRNNPINMTFSTLPAKVPYNFTVTDSRLAYCWYFTSENATITPVTCNSVFNITFNSYGGKTVTFLANDTLNNTNSDVSMIQVASENSQTYQTPVTEGTIQMFAINISYNSTNLTSPSAILVYNNTAYIGLVSGTGDNLVFSRNITVPLVDANTNKSFYWNITFGSKVFQSSVQQQTLLNTQIFACTNSSAVFSFRVVDEASQVLIPNATMEWSFVFRNVDGGIVLRQNISTSLNPNGVCSNVPLPGDSFSIDGTIKYYNETHAIEYYEIRNYTWVGNFTTQNITLYDLLLTDSTDFQVTFNGLDFLPAPNVILYLERQYLSEGTFKVVEAPITDSNGQTILHMVQNNIYYNIIAVKDGEVLGVYSNIRAFCQDSLGTCTITLTAREGDIFVPDFNSITDTGVIFLGSPSLNTTTQLVTASFVSTDATIKNVTIVVNRNDVFGNQTLCSNSINAISGTVTCQLDPLFSETSVITNIYIDGQLAVLESTEGEGLGYGSIGYLAWFVATLVLILIFADNKNLVIAMMFVSYVGAILCGLTLGKLIGLGSGLGSAGIWIIAITIVALYQLNKRRVE